VARTLKILSVHGVGGHDVGGEWTDEWTHAIETPIKRIAPDAGLGITFINYDDVFDAHAITAGGTLEAIARLGASGVWYGVGDAVGSVLGGGRAAARNRSRRASSIPERVRWTAGMVVQWAENDAVRRGTRRRLADAIGSVKPDVILAHSLGSLIAYDTFVQPDNAGLLEGVTFVSFGSQIGNPFVRAQFGGRIVPLACEHWYHLYNEEDDIFTAPLSVSSGNFEQVETPFDLSGFGDHDAVTYLQHANTASVLWRDVLSPRRLRAASRKTRADVESRVRSGGGAPARSRRRARDRRALLIGINDYPNPADRLDGCVNDVYLMNEVLQESGYDASQIRSVLDHRATANGIRDRIHWLLDGTRAGDERVLYFSGHGTQISDYGADETVDRRDECLVPHDFDWTRESAIVDDWFHALYTQLDYEARFIAIFDCCHSGGMTRAGAGRPKGLSPPDDIRHRTMRWDPGARSWVERELESPNASLAASHRGRDYLGACGSKRRLGRGTDVLTLDNRRYDTTCRRYGHHGPYLPVIVQACREDQVAYEHRHGATSYGAFTWSLAQELRSDDARRGLSMDSLHARIVKRIGDMGLEQSPELVGPADVRSRPVRWCQLSG